MTFSHDTELSLLAVVELTNTDPISGSVEGLPDAASVAAFVRRHRISGVDPRDYEDVDALYQVRSLFRTVFGNLDASQTAHLVNLLLADASVRPRLTDHDDHDWHMHYFAPGASLAEHVRVDGAMALAQVVAAEETDRLRVCDAPDCEAVFIDLSRNRSKRYCDARSCGNRLNVAAYRQRKRSESLALDEA